MQQPSAPTTLSTPSTTEIQPAQLPRKDWRTPTLTILDLDKTAGGPSASFNESTFCKSGS